jgi:predicted dienelactone hydrolase
MRIAKVAGVIVAVVALCVVGVAAYLYASASRPARPVGFEEVSIADPGHPALTAAIWYPTDAQPGFVLVGLTAQRVSSGGPIAGDRLPVVVMSHGTGGSFATHADTALALAANGYVVVAPLHTGDNFRDDSAVGKPNWLPDRSRHLRLALDAVLGKWRGAAHIDPQRVGVFGFSAGATTALISIGGTPDLLQVPTHCQQHPEFVCQLMSPPAAQPPVWLADPRIRAAVIVAPGLGFAFAPDGLRNVRVPVQLWAGSADVTVPGATNAQLVETSLPRSAPAEMHLVPAATHYSFAAPCGLLGPPQLCRDAEGFDRKAFHETFNSSIVQFFDARLLPRS